MKATEENNISTGSPLLRISKRLFFVTILLMPFFRPSGINYILPGGQYVYDAFSMASLGILVIIYLSGEKQLIDWQIILSGLMFLVIMFSTIRNHGDTMVHLRVTAACFGIMLGVSDLRKTPKLLMLALLLDSEILIYINLICLFLFPGGMYLSHITEKLFSKIDEKAAFIAAYTQNGEIAGYCAIYDNDQTNKVAYISLFCVRKKCRECVLELCL